jgi:SAM-dependent methyltransferase
MTTLASYDALPYESIPISETHVDGLAALGRLFGVATADPERCRVLELGCAEGGNLIPMAFYLPDSRFVGIDLSLRQVETGRRLIRDLGLANVALLHRDVMDATDDLGRFDYIIAHGLYSWVPEPVRDRVMAICRDHLAEGGLAYVSWNALPGWHTRAVMRDMLLHHVRREASPQARLALAYRFLEDYGAGLAEEAGDLAGILAAEVDYLRRAPPSYLYHEYLVETNTPMLFSDFAAHAERHGLQYVADVDLYTLLPHTLGQAGRAALAGIADRIGRIQAMDFLRARRFHRSLLTHATTGVHDAPDMAAFRRLAFHADLTSDEEIDLASPAAQAFVTPTGARYAVRHPLAKAALMHLASVYPDSVAWDDLYASAVELVASHGDAELAGEEAAFAGEWLDLVAWGAVRPATSARRLSCAPGARPRAHALALAQLAQGGDCVASIRHTAVHLDAPGARLLGLLDGQRDLDDLVAAMQADVPEAVDVRDGCERLLWTFARYGLLAA